MSYESSYESGRKPFQPDPARGFWSDPRDFIYISLSLAFKLDAFYEPVGLFGSMGVFSFIPYLICAAIYIVPLMILQSFMGQFSSSGFISAFRVTPLFKGIGYISLAINYVVLLYYVVFANVPLLFFFYSFYPTLPWSCEGYDHSKFEALNLTESEKYTICNVSMITPEEFEKNVNSSNEGIFYKIPSELFFHEHFSNFDYDGPLSFSWELLLVTMLTWGVIAGIFYKCFNTEKLGTALRYMIWGTMAVMTLLLIRFLCLPGAAHGFDGFIIPDFRFDPFYSISLALGLGMASLGPGWGSILTLASFNKFNANIIRDSWIICIGQMFIFFAFLSSATVVNWHFTHITASNYQSFVMSHWDLYVTTGSAIASMELPNLWSLLFYGMLFSAALVFIITQLHIVIVSVFDEFVVLRQYKLSVVFSIIGSLALFSVYLCTNHGLIYFTSLSADTFFTQTSLNLLLLLVVLWIYGRERFQRDFEFMLGQRFQTWKVNILRFVAPIFLLFTLLMALGNMYFEHWYTPLLFEMITLLFTLIPWLFIPGYAIFYMLQTTGDVRTRFKRTCRPTDWYPVDSNDRQRYEEYLGNMDITHQLSNIDETQIQVP